MLMNLNIKEKTKRLILTGLLNTVNYIERVIMAVLKI